MPTDHVSGASEPEIVWQQTHMTCRRVADLIKGLSEAYTREGVHIWLTGRHRLLDNRIPLDVMREPGGLERLEQLLDQLRTGAFV